MVIGENLMTLAKSYNNIANKSKRLSVQISLTGLSFLVTSCDDKEVLFFFEKKFDSSLTPEETLETIQQVIEKKQELATYSYDEVVLLYATNLYTTVPTALFDENKASDYLKFNSKILANDYISFDTIQSLDMVIVYVPFINVNNYFFEKYGSFKYYHTSTILINTLVNSEKFSKEEKLYIHVQSNTFDCLAIQNGNLTLCNTFSYKTPEDFIYYILFCMEQLTLNPESTAVFLLGAISKEDELYDIAYKYIRNVSFISEIKSNINLGKNISNHNHFVLKSSL